MNDVIGFNSDNVSSQPRSHVYRAGLRSVELIRIRNALSLFSLSSIEIFQQKPSSPANEWPQTICYVSHFIGNLCPQVDILSVSFWWYYSRI